MENALFALFMMGCGHNLDVCRPVPAPVEYYASEADCLADFDDLMRQDTSFPMTVGTCVAVAPEKAESDVTFQWFFAANGSLVVEPVLAAQTRTAAAERTDRLPDQQG